MKIHNFFLLLFLKTMHLFICTHVSPFTGAARTFSISYTITGNRTHVSRDAPSLATIFRTLYHLITASTSNMIF